jgi:hypothetical protein
VTTPAPSPRSVRTRRAVIDAAAALLAEEAALPDTGTARGDFTEQVGRVSTFYASPLGNVLAQLLASATQDADAAEWLRTRFLASRQNGIQELWGRAVARGEVRDDVDPDIAIDILFGPVMWRLISRQKPLTQAEAEALTDMVLNGMRKPNGASGPRRPAAPTGDDVGFRP